MSPSRASAASTTLIAAVLAAAAFGASGGTELGRTSLVQALLVLLAGLVVAGAVLLGRPGRTWGDGTVLVFAGFAAFTALSITWSITPDLSYIEAGRTLAYLAVFAAAVAAARLAPGGAPPLAGALLLAASAVVAYGLAARVWPGALSENELSARLGQPYGYWNALGTTAAMVVPAALWLGSRRSGHPAVTALAYPALGFAIVAIMLTQSRGALATALIAAVLWFALVPLRLRSLPVAILPTLGGGALAAWALSKQSFTFNPQTVELREAVASEFGALLVLLALGLFLCGIAVHLLVTHNPPSMRLRKGVGAVALATACAVPLVLAGAVALSERGLGGTVSDRVKELTSETADQPGQGAERFTGASSSRSTYWRQAGEIFDDQPAEGTGAGSFGIARLRYRKDELVSAHAHGYVAQTLADLGWVGLIITLALLVAWLGAAARATGFVRRRGPEDRRDWTRERVALVCVGLVAVTFGLQSAIDWTWFVTGPAVMALVAAGFVAGRGPLAERQRPDVAARPSVPRLLATAAVLLCAVLFAWTIWQPQQAENAADRALDQVEKGDLTAAQKSAEEARDLNPTSPRPLFVKAVVEQAQGREQRAYATLRGAVLDHAGDPQSWIRLASFELERLDKPADALQTLQGALYLDPKSKAARQLFLDARAVLRSRNPTAPIG